MKIEQGAIRLYTLRDPLKTGLCEIGNGNPPWKRMIDAAEKGGSRWFAVDRDSWPGGPFDAIRRSFDSIAQHLVEGPG